MKFFRLSLSGIHPFNTVWHVKIERDYDIRLCSHINIPVFIDEVCVFKAMWSTKFNAEILYRQTPQ